MNGMTGAGTTKKTGKRRSSAWTDAQVNEGHGIEPAFVAARHRWRCPSAFSARFPRGSAPLSQSPVTDGPVKTRWHGLSFLCNGCTRRCCHQARSDEECLNHAISFRVPADAVCAERHLMGRRFIPSDCRRMTHMTTIFRSSAFPFCTRYFETNCYACFAAGGHAIRLNDKFIAWPVPSVL